MRTDSNKNNISIIFSLKKNTIIQSDGDWIVAL